MKSASDHMLPSARELYQDEVFQFNKEEEVNTDMVDIHPSRTRRIRRQEAEIKAAQERIDAQTAAYHLHHEAQRKKYYEPLTG